jgi:hypothetical protein
MDSGAPSRNKQAHSLMREAPQRREGRRSQKTAQYVKGHRRSIAMNQFEQGTQATSFRRAILPIKLLGMTLAFTMVGFGAA